MLIFTESLPWNDLHKIVHCGHWMTRLQNCVEIVSEINADDDDDCRKFQQAE